MHGAAPHVQTQFNRVHAFVEQSLPVQRFGRRREVSPVRADGDGEQIRQRSAAFGFGRVDPIPSLVQRKREQRVVKVRNVALCLKLTLIRWPTHSPITPMQPRTTYSLTSRCRRRRCSALGATCADVKRMAGMTTVRTIAIRNDRLWRQYRV